MYRTSKLYFLQYNFIKLLLVCIKFLVNLKVILSVSQGTKNAIFNSMKNKRKIVNRIIASLVCLTRIENMFPFTMNNLFFEEEKNMKIYKVNDKKINIRKLL